jgi:hypothetical protein
VQFGYRGCFGGSDNLLEVHIGDRASAQGSRFVAPGRHRIVAPVALTKTAARSIVEKLVLAAQRVEVDDGTESTTMAFARIFYWCGDRKEGPVMLRTYADSLELQRYDFPIVEVRTEGYARANGPVAGEPHDGSTG